MIPYRPPPFKLATSTLGVPWDKVVGAPPPYGDVVRIAGHSVMAAVGIYTGLEAPGFWSAAGWVVGVGSSICALLEIADLVIPE